MAKKSESPAVTAARASMVSLAIAEIAPAEQNRDIGSIDDIRDSMSELGLIEPIIVAPRVVEGVDPMPSKRFTIVAGERRYRAALALGWTEIDAIVREAGGLAEQLAENIVRKQIRPAEMAAGLSTLKSKPRTDGKPWTGKLIAQAVGLSEGYVNNLIRLREKLAPELWEMFRKLPAGSGEVRRFIEASGLKADDAQIAFIAGKVSATPPAEGGEGDNSADDDSAIDDDAAPAKKVASRFVITPAALATLCEDAPTRSYMAVMQAFLLGKRATLPASFYEPIPRGKRGGAEEE